MYSVVSSGSCGIKANRGASYRRRIPPTPVTGLGKRSMAMTGLFIVSVV